MDVPFINAAITFEPDGYLLSGDQLMGRQAAGNAFLRAAVAGRQEQPLWGYTPYRRSAEIFRQLVREIDPSAEARWLPAESFDLLTQLGTLYLPGPGLNAASRLRLRAGPVAYSLCGVTHTTATHNAMDQIAALLTAPVMPWDALICTSQAALYTVKTVLEDESTYLRWRFESALCLTIPQLPVIPLGVHCTDFTFDQEERAFARQALGIAEDEVVVLFVGRLSYHAKAHPHAMYVGLKAAAERTGIKPVLIQCGWFGSDHIEQAFRTGAAQYAPDIRVLFTNGRDPDARRQTWAAGDLFISLSDNIQETFGLTPIEAMAAGLPAVVTDWDGYKDTVRDGVDGFRIPTFMPPKLGERFAQAYEAGTDNYDYYCGLVCQAVSVDIGVLVDRLSDLIANVSLRQQMGEAGRQRARAVFDWTVVYRQYQQLWMELTSIRLSAQRDFKQQEVLMAAPKVASSRADPFRSFGHYPTTLIQPTMRVALVPGVTASQYRTLAAHPLYNYARKSLPRPEIVEQLFAKLGKEDLIIQELVRSLGLNPDAAVLVLAMLAKMGLVRFASTKPDAPP